MKFSKYDTELIGIIIVTKKFRNAAELQHLLLDRKSLNTATNPFVTL